VTKFFPFIFSALVDKLECTDLEGVSDLPEDIRPTPSQKPHKVNKLTENCEEIRVLYIKLLESLIFNSEEDELNTDNYITTKSNDEFRMFIQDIVNITRTLCMDPCATVVLESCYFMKKMCIKFGKDLLFFFNSILSRAIYYPLTHKQSKMRLAALECLDVLMYCSPYKKNVEIMEQLIGFRDPNLVPIKDFYEPSTKLNYMALLISDPSNQVVKKFFEVITNWLIKLEDRFDHEARLIPYVLSGLFCSNEEISLYVSQRMEEIGKQYEIDNEKEIREERQFAIDSPWVKLCSKTEIDSSSGFSKITFNTNLYYPFPIANRPCLGARLLVRKYLRRYIKNLCKEYESIEEGIKIRVSNLILYSIIYAEDSIIEYLDQIFLCFQKEITRVKAGKGITKDSVQIVEPMIKSLKLLGRFCDYESITKLIYPTIVGDLNASYPDIQKGGLICLRYILIGHLESISGGFGIFEEKLGELSQTLTCRKFIEYLDSSTGMELIDFYENLFSLLNEKKEKFGDSLNQITQHLDSIFDQIIQGLGAVAIFDIHGVSNNETISKIEKYLNSINKNINELLHYINKTDVENSVSFFTSKVKETLLNIKSFVENNPLTLNTRQYKIFYIFLKQIKLFMKIDQDNKDKIELHKYSENVEILKQTLKIFSKIFGSSYNFPIHQDTMKLLTGYLNQSLIDVNKNSHILVPLLDEMVLLLISIFKNYDNVEIDKFKFADLLKDEKEIEKKKLKSPKTIKSDIREKGLIILKTMLNKNQIFSVTSNKEFINNFIIIFNSSLVNDFIHEKEPVRKLFVEIYYLFLVKYFAINKVHLNFSKNFSDQTEEFKTLKSIINIFEDYFADGVYDSVLEVRQMSLNILTLILCVIERSEFYEPMCSLFESFKTDRDHKKFNYECLKVLAYVEEENKKIETLFKNFKNIFSIVINLFIDEKVSFGNLCEGLMKNAIDKFPIFCFNELTKARNKNQMSRVEVLDRMFNKFLKIK
jgi:hypothetical protein